MSEFSKKGGYRYADGPKNTVPPWERAGDASLPSTDIDSEINSFLDFWEDHCREPDELRVSNWILRTPGCNGDFGCCSKSYDLSSLTDTLYELAGRPECHSHECAGRLGCGHQMRINLTDLPAASRVFICTKCGTGWNCSREPDGKLTWKSFYRETDGVIC